MRIVVIGALIAGLCASCELTFPQSIIGSWESERSSVQQITYTFREDLTAERRTDHFGTTSDSSQTVKGTYKVVNLDGSVIELCLGASSARCGTQRVVVSRHTNTLYLGQSEYTAVEPRPVPTVEERLALSKAQIIGEWQRMDADDVITTVFRTNGSFIHELPNGDVGEGVYDIPELDKVELCIVLDMDQVEICFVSEAVLLGSHLWLWDVKYTRQ